MPKRYAVMLPNASQRRKILNIMLRKTNLAKDFNLDFIVDRTEGKSGSDLKEMCRTAAMAPVREYLRSKEGQDAMTKARARNRAIAAGSGAANTSKADLKAAQAQTRPVKTEDFFRMDSMELPKGVDFLLNQRPAHAPKHGP